MTDDPPHMWTSTELHELYRNENGQQTRKYILEKLKLHFGKDLVVTHILGCASLACLKDQIPAYLRLVDCGDDDAYVSVLPRFSKGQGAILEKVHVECSEQYLKKHWRSSTK